MVPIMRMLRESWMRSKFVVSSLCLLMMLSRWRKFGIKSALWARLKQCMFWEHSPSIRQKAVGRVKIRLKYFRNTYLAAHPALSSQMILHQPIYISFALEMGRGAIQARCQNISRLDTSKAEPKPGVLRDRKHIPTAKFHHGLQVFVELRSCTWSVA